MSASDTGYQVHSCVMCAFWSVCERLTDGGGEGGGGPLGPTNKLPFSSATVFFFLHLKVFASGNLGLPQYMNPSYGFRVTS